VIVGHRFDGRHGRDYAIFGLGRDGVSRRFSFGQALIDKPLICT